VIVLSIKVQKLCFWSTVFFLAIFAVLNITAIKMHVAQHTTALHLQIHTHTHTHTHPFNGPFAGLTGRASTRKVKPILISLKQETVSGSGISWAICKSALRSRQITTPAPHHSVFLQAGRPSCRPTNSVKALKMYRLNVNRCFTSKCPYLTSVKQECHTVIAFCLLLGLSNE